VLAVVLCAVAVAAAAAVARADASNDQETLAGSGNELRNLRELLASQAFATVPPQPIGTITLDDATFEIHDFSFSAENTAGMNSGGGAGKASLGSVTVKKISDSSSPSLFGKLIAGSQYGSATIIVRKPGAGAFLVYKFGTVATTKIEWGGPGEQGPEETITLNFGDVEITFVSQDSGVTSSGVFNAPQ
jgi:type VI protein secretion system component Hcp